MRQAEGDLASAKADVTLKRQNLERKKILVPLQAASQLDLDQATAELAQAEATVVIKQAALESAQANLGYCKITAPVDGIVISRKVDLGQTVIAAMSTPVLFTIAQDITKMNISASVSEADIGQVQGRPAGGLHRGRFPRRSFSRQGHRRFAKRRRPRRTSSPTRPSSPWTIPEQKLFPGMTADVSILVAERNNVLKIPNTALRYTPPEGATFEQTPPAKLERSQRLVYALGSGWRETQARHRQDRHHRRRGHGNSRRSHRMAPPVVTSTLSSGAKAAVPSAARPRQRHEHGNQQRTRHPAPRPRQDVPRPAKSR